MYKKRFQGWLKHWDFMLLDIASLLIGYLCAYLMLRGFIMSERPYMFRDEAILLVVAVIIVSFFSTPFKNVLKRGFLVELAHLLQHAMLVLIVNVLLLFLLHLSGYLSRRLVGWTIVFYLLIAYLVRIWWKYYLLHKQGARKPDVLLLVITTEAQAEEVVQEIVNNPFNRYEIAAVVTVDSETPTAFDKKIPMLGAGEDVEAFVCHRWVDEAYVQLPETEPIPSAMLGSLQGVGITVHMALDMLDLSERSEHYVEKIGGRKVLTSSLKLVSSQQMAYKRLLDILGGLVGCAVTGVLALILAPLIKSKSPGPLFFSQTRVGKNGRPFKMYKFRSMYMDAEERKAEYLSQTKMDNEIMFKMDDDPRIIGSEKKGKDGQPKGIGNFIRRTSIDEFPQFWNVLKGDMSLVGTRPPTVDEWERYSYQHRIRMAIKPGITGLWQVSGRNSITDFDKIIELDKEYIFNWSLRMDMKIIAKTFKVVFSREGAV